MFWGFAFLCLSLVAAALGFSGALVVGAWLCKVLFVVFTVLSLTSVLTALAPKGQS